VLESDVSTLSAKTATKIAQLFRMLSSPYENEAHNALRMMTRTLAAEGLSFNDVATVFDNAAGEIDGKLFSESDAKKIFERGLEKRRAEQARKQASPSDYYGEDGEPLWPEIAQFCHNSVDRLHSEWERTFIEDMSDKVYRYVLSEKQMKKLFAIFIKLGGPRRAK
jgi:hypothetical protein